MISKAQDARESQIVAKSPTQELIIFGAQPNQKQVVLCERRRREQKILGNLDVSISEKYPKRLLGMFLKGQDRLKSQTAAESPSRELLIFGAYPN